MRRELRFTAEAAANLKALEATPSNAGTFRQVRKTLGLLETDPRHPSLHTHKYDSIAGPDGEEVFEAYAQNNTPSAYRVFFIYGPDRYDQRKRIPVITTILAITPHP